MYFGQRNYQTGFLNRIISRGSGDVEQAHAYCFTCQETCNVTAVGFHIASVNGTSSTKFKIGFQYLTGINNLPTDNYFGSGSKTVSLGGTGTPKGWVYVTADSYSWSLVKDSKYALVIDTYSTALGGPTTTNHITLTVPQPVILTVPYSGFDDPVRRVAWKDLGGAFWQYSVANSGQLCFYYKAATNASSDGCLYHDDYSQSLSAGANSYMLHDIKATGKFTISTAWVGVDVYIDPDLYGYSPVLLDVKAIIKSWTLINKPNADLNYEIRNSSGTILASAVLATPYSMAYTLRTSSVKIDGVATALALNAGETYKFVLRPKNTAGYYETQLLQATPTGAKTPFATFQSANAYAQVSRDGGNTWIDGAYGGYAFLPLYGTIIDFRGQVNGSDFHSCIVASIAGFGDVVTPSADGSYHLIASGTPEGSAYLKVSDYHFEVDPHYLLISSPTCTNWATLIAAKGTSMPEATLTDTEMWWDYDSATGRGKHYAFRETINFSSSHDLYKSGMVFNEVIPTGLNKKFFSSADFSWGISEYNGHICYYNKRTYITWRDTESKANICYYNHITESMSTVYNLGYIKYNNSFTDDTHYYPQLAIDNSGYIWVFFSQHLAYPYYRKSDNPEDITSFSARAVVPNSTTCSYLRPRINPITGDVWIFGRAGAGTNNSYWSGQKYNSTSETWESYKYIAEFLSSYTWGGVWSNSKSVYCGGVQFDENGYCYLVLCFLQGYSNDTQWEVANTFNYSPDMENWYDIAGDLSGVSGSNPIDWNEGYFFFNGSGTYPSGGTNEDNFQVLDSLYDNGTHTIHLPIIAWTQKHTSVMYPVFPVVTYWDTAGSSWRTVSVAGYEEGDGKYYLGDAHQFGLLSKDDDDTIYSFGFCPLGTTTGTTNDWGLYDFVYFTSDTSWGTQQTFTPHLISKNRSGGAGKIAMKYDYDANKMIEGIYNIDRDLYYFQLEKSDYGYVRRDRNDLCIVYDNQEIPSVVDRVGDSSSKVYFKIQTALSADSSYPYHTRYQAYYGYQSSAWYTSSNPYDIWSIYDNFEDYDINTTVTGLGNFRWTVLDATAKATANPALHVTGLNSYDIQDIGAINFSNMACGLQSLWFRSFTHTVVCATTLPSELQNSCEMKVSVMRGYYYDHRAFIGFITSGGTAIGCGVGRTTYGDIGQVERHYGTPYDNFNFTIFDLATAYQYRTQWEEYTLRLTSGVGITCYWRNSSVYSTSLGAGGISTAYFGISKVAGNGNYFDFVRIGSYKA